MASLGRAAGWGQRGINIATTVANGTQGGFTNSYTLYQQAKAYGASEQQARCAAGWGFLAGTTTAIPVTQWSLRLERGAEVFAPISRMTLEAVEAGGQGLVLGAGNEVIAQQIYDKNRDVLANIVGEAALNSGAAGIVSFLTSVVARARHTPIDYKIKWPFVKKSAPAEWAVSVGEEVVFKSASKEEADAYAAKLAESRDPASAEETAKDQAQQGGEGDSSKTLGPDGNEIPKIEKPQDWNRVFQGRANVIRLGVPTKQALGIDNLTGDKITALAGAPYYATIEATGSGSSGDGSLTMEVKAPELRSYLSSLERTKKGLVLHLSMMEVREGTMEGYGAHSFASTVSEARKMGIKEIVLYAAGDIEGAGGYIGYHVWPRFGFDNDIPQAVIAKLPPHLADAKRISDLMWSRTGRDFWTVHGTGLHMVFDLNNDSISMRLFKYYEARKGYNYGKHDPNYRKDN